jgi:hypothetical protein
MVPHRSGLKGNTNRHEDFVPGDDQKKCGIGQEEDARYDDKNENSERSGTFIE